MPAKVAPDWSKNSVGEFLEYHYADVRSSGKECPRWPPDLFALTASLLHETGAYIRLVEILSEGEAPLLDADWPEQAREMGRLWRKSFEAELPPPPDRVLQWWSELIQGGATDLQELIQEDALCRATLALALVADEACAGIDLRTDQADEFLSYAKSKLIDNRHQSLCKDVHPGKAKVLPKQHATQRGITLRSISHHLALIRSNDVEVIWRVPVAGRPSDKSEVLNLLLLPWPEKLEAEHFEPVIPVGGEFSPLLMDPYRFFGFARKTSEGFEQSLINALREASKIASRIDIVVLPELSMTYEEYLKAEEICIKDKTMLVGGVMEQGPCDQTDSAAKPNSAVDNTPTNCCYSQPLGMTAGKYASVLGSFLRGAMRVRQSKHHRWFLDRSQIVQYGLGGRLSASKLYWEYAAVESRKVNFFTLGTQSSEKQLTFCVLICEDLARQDPVAGVLRAMGPDLVIALLMDGPQLVGRWPSKYASVLADDPGSSVLSLTSLGMSRLSKPLRGERDRSRVIALWQDVQYGAQELELSPQENACVLSLVCEQKTEFTADGRNKRRSFPVYAGYHPFHVPMD